MNSNELKQQRAELIGKCRAITDKAEQEKRSCNTEELSEIEKIQVDIVSLREQVRECEAKEFVSSCEKELKEPAKRSVLNPSTRQENRDASRAYNSWLTRGVSNPSMDDICNASACGVDLNSNSLNLGAGVWENRSHARSQVVGTAGAGGYLAPSNLPVKFLQFMNYYSPIRNFANLLLTPDNRTIPFLQGDDTANSATLTTEGNAVGFNDATVAKVDVGAYKWTSGVKVSVELMLGSLFDPDTWVAKNLANRARTTTDPLYATGSGSGTIQGVATAATTSVDLATAAITWDSVFDLMHSIPRQYRDGMVFIMTDLTSNALMKLKSTTGEYLYDDTTVKEGSTFDSIKGYPVIINNSLDELTATDGNCIVAAGMFNEYYVIREVANQQIIRLDQLYRANGLLGYMLEFFQDARWVGPSSAIKKLIS